VNLTRARDLEREDERKADFSTLFHAIAGLEKNAAKREILGHRGRVGWTGRAGQGNYLLDGYARVLAAVRVCAHLLNSTQ